VKLWKKLLIAAVIVVAATAVAIVWWRWPKATPVAAEQTVLVISPHPDDETYAMGQAVAEQVLAGKRVIGVLLTDGEGSDRAEEWPDQGGIDYDDDGDVDKWDFGMARRAEYVAAMTMLGVKELHFLGASNTQGAEGFEDGELEQAEVERAVEGLAAENGPVSHMTLMKYLPDHRFRGDARLHPDHTVTCDAVKAVAERRGEDAYFYKVYILYRTDWWKRWSPVFVGGSDEAFARKRRAIDAYEAMGKASTPDLWQAARNSGVEYLVRPSDF